MGDDGMDTEDCGTGGAPARDFFNCGDGEGGTVGHDATNVREIFGYARRMINEGKPSLALHAVMAAMRSKGGDAAVIATMNRARQLFMARLQENAAADELASLLAECAIAESGTGLPENPPDPPGPLADATSSSILALNGKKQIMLDAFSDGSSFVCLQCGGLVSNLRREEHFAFWCGPRV